MSFSFFQIHVRSFYLAHAQSSFTIVVRIKMLYVRYGCVHAMHDRKQEVSNKTAETTTTTTEGKKATKRK